MQLVRVGERRGKVLYRAAVDSVPASFDRSALSGKFFHVLVCVETPLDEARFRSFARDLLEAGAVFVMTAGPAAERAHDLFDEVIIGGDFRVDETTGIRTIAAEETNDEGEEEPGEGDDFVLVPDLEDAVHLIASESFTTEACEREREAALFISIGGAKWRERLRAAVDWEASSED